jgi:hypothetical protein
MKTKFTLIVSIVCLLITLTTNAQNWLTTGNSGTNPTINFLGTKDSKALTLRTHNVERMRITLNGKIGIGTTTPQQKLDVHGNIKTDSAIYIADNEVMHISRSANFFVGQFAGYYNSFYTGDANTALGFEALYYNKDGDGNTAAGSGSLFNNTSGDENTAYGGGSLSNNTTGSYNTACGSYTMSANTTGSYCVAFGWGSLNYNNGSYNSAVGISSLYNNTTGAYNTSVGSKALYFNTTGSYNTATGNLALNENTTGSGNTASGHAALVFNEAGIENSAFGYQALEGNDSGNRNTAIGSYSLAFNYSGDNNTACGYEANANRDNLTNSTAIGNTALITASNQVRIGNSDVTSIGGYSNWTNISDIRVKKNIKENVPGLAFINKLKPITYNLNLDAADKIIQRPVSKTTDEKFKRPAADDVASRKAKEEIVYTGFSAQDVEKSAKEIGYNFSGVDAAKNDKDLYGLRYAEFVVPLVKAVQELSKMNDEKDSAIKNLQQQVNELKTMIISNQSTLSNQQSVNISSASLAQNIPNPFLNTTTINYSLPKKYSSAKLIITDNKGLTLKQINLTAKGKGNIQVDATTLAAGAYQYSLFVNDKLVATKQMLLQK